MNNLTNKLTIAQIGVGYWGPNLLRNLYTNSNCEVATVVDLSEERRQFVQKNFPTVQTTDDVSLAIDDPTVDAVVISTPVATHFDLAMRALEAGKHILVEKPMAETVEEVAKIESLARQKNLVAMVGHTFIYNSAVRYLKKLIDSGELGQVRYIYSQRLNLGRVRTDVDALWNFAPHDVSIVQYLLGDPLPVSIHRHGIDHVQRGIDDVVFLNVVYPNKVMVNIHVSWLDPCKTRRMVVVGSEKMVVYDDISENKIVVYDKGVDRMAVLGENMDYDNPNAARFNHRSGDIWIPKVNFVEPLKSEIAHFVDCIANGTPCMTDTTHALRVTKILSEAQRANESNEENFDPKPSPPQFTTA